MSRCYGVAMQFLRCCGYLLVFSCNVVARILWVIAMFFYAVAMMF